MKDLENFRLFERYFLCKHWYGVTKDTHKSFQPRQLVVRLAFVLGTASSSRIERYVFMRLLGHLRVVPFNLRRLWTCIPSSQFLYCAGNTVLFLCRFLHLVVGCSPMVAKSAC